MATTDDATQEHAVVESSAAHGDVPDLDQVEEAHARLVRERHGGDGAATSERDGQSLVEQAAQSLGGAKRLDQQQRTDAMAWLLADDDEDMRTETWEFNVGTDDNPTWVEWQVGPIDADTMKELRARARQAGSQNRQQRRQRTADGEDNFDVTLFNLLMVAHSTVSPNLGEVAAQRGVLVNGDMLAGPVEILKHRFRNKPGIVDQIAGKIMKLSGYDDDDAAKVTPQQTMVSAAGNS